MSTSGIPAKNIYNTVLKDTNFSKVHDVLVGSNINKYIQMTSSEEILRRNLFRSRDINDENILDSKLKKVDDFYIYVAKLFQSLTNLGLTTYEITSFIINSIKSNRALKSNKNEIIEFLSNSLCIMHTDYSNLFKEKDEKEILDSFMFGHGPKDHFNIGLVFGQSKEDIIIRSPNQIFKKDLKILSAFTGINYHAHMAQASNNKQKAIDLGTRFNFNNNSLNTNIINPSKTQTSVSSIILSNPKIRIGTQNNLELSAFFNSFTNIELNKSYPYLNATFILPKLARSSTENKILKTSLARSSTINNFLFGNESNVTNNYNNLAGDVVDEGLGTIKSNMSMFTMPQTYVNFNENIGHDQNTVNENRFTPVIDPTQPFMTIKNFSINASSTKGLMSYKSGKLSLVLHDRSRLNDIAPFVKPDLFGTFGSEIVLEYGWSNIDGENRRNPVGYFIGNSKVVEKYMIVNSSFSIDNTGHVNIDLSIAMKGPYHFKNQTISTEIHNRVKQSEFENAIGLINYNRSLINKADSFLEDYKLNANTYPNIFSKTTIINRTNIDNINKFIGENLFIKQVLEKNPGLISVRDDSVNANVTIIIKKDSGLFSGSSTSKKKRLDKILHLLSLKKYKQDALKHLNNARLSNIEITIKTKNKSSEVMGFINQVVKSTSYIISLLGLVSVQDEEEEEARKTVLENIVGSIDIIDPFYPTDSKTFSKITNHFDYVSLGSVINTIVQAYIANVKGDKRSQFDEIQTIFYTCNSHAAGMSNRPISSFLISKKMLTNLLEDIFSKKAIITPESLISQILTNCVHVHDNISLGLTNLYENRKSARDPLKPKETIIKNEWQATKDSILHEIYYGTSKIDPANDVKFVTPVVHMNFDCLTSGDLNKERTILRISIFDRADSPFAASSSLLEKLYSGDINKALENINKTRIDLVNKRSAGGVNHGNTSYEKFKINKNAEIEKLLKAKIIKYDNATKLYSINFDEITEKSMLSGKIKEAFKEIYPSLTFGNSNSALISASVSSINDNKLSTIFITRPDRNNVSSINDRIQQTDLPLRVLPSQASVELHGCPWVNFGQSIFLDFNTGTSVDNKYVVTGINHNISPGKFTTQLTLAYGDNYGQFESAVNTLNDNTSGNTLEKRNFDDSVNVNQKGQIVSDIIVIGPDTQKGSNGLYKPNLAIGTNPNQQ